MDNKNYRNEYLFSEIYLQDITQRHVTDENLRASFQTINEWREYADKSSLKQWITTYIEPVLDTLGFGHHKDQEGQANILLLFPDVDKTQPMSLCWVVPPGDDIDCALKGKHWAEKIIRNLRKYNFEWGILTDGIYWRIYHTKEPTPYETYVEVDLEAILSNQDYAAFQIFYFFFRPANFIKGENGECKFDIYKEESAKTTEYIEENLRAAIEREEEGEGVLQTLCLGYLDVLNQNTYNEEECVRIYGGAILYLFRLLFLFYSTARGLLKRENIESFMDIVQTSFRLHNEGGARSNSCDLWLRLQDLFAEIDLTYNGGLFNPHESNLTRFIEKTKITDSFLLEVVFGLGYYQKSRENFVFIEYRDLSVRHLGSLYEGLLEHNLFIAPENTVVRRSGTKVRFVPESEAGRITRSETIIEKGKVYFSEDARERKLTGSYYTPEDVVEYIVKNTIDALLAEKRKELTSEIEPILDDLNSAVNESEQRRLELFIDDKILKFIEEKILSISVLDPTMGSGHFLVNATNHIANFIVEILNEYSGCNSKIDSNPGFWRRRVVEDCIYGVDLNPLAVELAKLCLWITTAFKEKPLSFLNHHLKQGNALVGVRISDLKEYLKKARSQYDLFMQSYINSINQAAESYKGKLSKLTEAREDIEEKKEKLEELDEELAIYKHLCNLFTHHLLGKIDENKLLSQVESWNKSDKLQKVSAFLNSKDFFHWDLEYPDVFYGDNSGFDCVIGNPPYVEYSKIRKQYKIVGYKTQKCGNLYAYVMERSLDLSRDSGICGIISQLSLISKDKMIPIQEILLSKQLRVASFGRRPCHLFNGADIQTCIVIVKNHPNQSNSIYTTKYNRWYQQERRKLFENLNFVMVENSLHLKGRICKISFQIEKNILNKIYKNKTPISSYFAKEKCENYIIIKTMSERYFNTTLNFKPIYSVNGKNILSSTSKMIHIGKKDDCEIICAILNSNLFWWFFEVYSDCWQLSDKEFNSFLIDLDNLEKPIKKSLIELNKTLIEEYKRNSKVKRIKYGKHTVQQQLFYPYLSKKTIDLIDQNLAKHYNLTEQELNFIINYDIRFRCRDEEKS